MKNSKEKFIPLSVPSITGNEWVYIKECLETEWVSTSGKYVDLFEQKIAEYTGSKFAIACVNGTSALHTSLLIAGVLPNDEVIVPSITFIAPVNTIRYCNAKPIFIDSDEYYNINVKRAIEFIENETIFKKGFTYNISSGNRISAIIPVHVFGNAVWLDDLFDICDKRNIKIIEDATESLGTRYLNGRFANKFTGTVGDMGCLSFNGNKIITTGGGGMILTDNPIYARKAKYLTTQAKDDENKYIHNEIGFNYRLTNIQAAMGVAQLEKLPEFLKRKKQNYELYKSLLSISIDIYLAKTPSYSSNNHWLDIIYLKNSDLDLRDSLIDFLLNKKIQVRPLWYPNHLQKPYQNAIHYKIERAKLLWQSTVIIPSSVHLGAEDIKYVTNCILEWKK